MSKKLFFILSVCILFFTGCTTEESVKLTEVEAQEWFNTNVTSENFQVLKYTQKIDWNNAIVTTGDHGEIIEVPFTVQSGLKTKVGEQPYLSHHRLLMKKSADGFTYNHVQILTNNKFFDNTDKSFNFYQITDNFDGIVLVVNQNNETVQFSSFKNSLLVKPSITGKMVAPTCVYLGWLYDDGDFEPLMLIGCFGGGGDPSDNGGYPPHVGGGGSGGAISTVNAAPSCESFNFVKTAGLWQVALVKNVRFKVFLLNEKGVEILHWVDFPQPISFGTPTNIQMGNTDITPGLAANASARALQKSMQDVIDKYGSSRTSDLSLMLYFQERLKHNYPLYIPGGRINFNATENIVATDYKTNPFTAGNCN